MFDARSPMTEVTGRAMAEWARGGGDSERQKALMDASRDVARTGKENFTAHWQGLSADDRAVVRTILGECQDFCKVADSATISDDDNPFGRPMVDATPSPEQLAQAEAATMVPGGAVPFLNLGAGR